jgi:hypothetical protein
MAAWPFAKLAALIGTKASRLLKTIDGRTLYGPVETKYYFAGGTRVAMRTGGTVRYLANDHLGRTAFVMNSSGGPSETTRG